jgi:hypothetical protein
MEPGELVLGHADPHGGTCCRREGWTRTGPACGRVNANCTVVIYPLRGYGRSRQQMVCALSQIPQQPKTSRAVSRIVAPGYVASAFAS